MVWRGAIGLPAPFANGNRGLHGSMGLSQDAVVANRPQSGAIRES